MTRSLIFGERYLSRVGAEFKSANQARHAAAKLVAEVGLPCRQVRVVEPHDRSVSRKLEPEPGGIARTLVRSHLTLGIAGGVLGLVTALVLIGSGIDAVASSPVYSIGVLASFGAILGMLLAGLVSLRPDHDLVIDQVEKAANEGRWSV
ncbi:MAG: hypothetical protein WAM94_07310, partial [Chromatiaceae bacterium]